MKAFLQFSLLTVAVALDEGTYFISSKSSGLELQANDLGDKFVSTRFQSHDDYSRFKVTAVSSGVYRLSVVADNRFLHADDLGTFQVATADYEDDYAHFEIQRALLGGYHVKTSASKRTWSLDSKGFLKTSSGSGDAFVFTKADPSPSPSPSPTPAGGCFRDIVWDESEIQKMEYVQFGSAVNPATGKTEDLHLDVYLPPDSDKRALRPAAVLVHGGGFVGGDRTCDGQPKFAMQLVRRGVVVVSIDYRQLGNDYDLSTSEVPENAATEDARAAVRFVRKNAAQFNIDPERIMMEGDSAGAITSLYLGFVKEAQGEGKSGNPGYRSDVRLAVSVSGQVKTQGYCDQIHPYPAGCSVQGDIDHVNDFDGRQGLPALFMIHGTEDMTVPYVNAKAVFDRAQAAGIASSLLTIENARHVPWDEFYSKPAYMKQLLDFMFEQMDLVNAECPQPSSVLV